MISKGVDVSFRVARAVAAIVVESRPPLISTATRRVRRRSDTAARSSSRKCPTGSRTAGGSRPHSKGKAQYRRASTPEAEALRVCAEGRRATSANAVAAGSWLISKSKKSAIARSFSAIETDGCARTPSSALLNTRVRPTRA